ncbi:MAG TPA: sialidase family protein [Thermoguttaceae bacterium]|nr:sialidase family protein [Thermoguttaceae bacterium]
MIHRRDFLKSSAATSFSLLTAGRLAYGREQERAAVAGPSGSLLFRLSRDVPTRLFDGERCWCHPRAGIVPGAGHEGQPRVVMTMNTMHLEGSDVFKGMYGLRTDDLGETWTEPREIDALAPRCETLDGQERPVAVSDFWPSWHAATKTLLGTGHTVVYTPDWKVTRPRPRHTSYSIYDADNDRWSAWRKLAMPDDKKFHDAGAGCTQRYDPADGTILLPIYFHPPGKSSHVAIARCTFDGRTLRYREHGNELGIDDETRGLHEPSLTRFGGQYFLTIRNDKLGFVTHSRDGLHFEPMRPWQFDDGSDLGNYNTQQHWVTHSEALFLVYTRRGANNDHVFRHRAPLFMAQVDTERLQVIRETERILVPQRGARLGNFGVTDISEEETWVTVAEWMQPRGVERHGSDGSVFVARIHWAKPNKNV